MHDHLEIVLTADGSETILNSTQGITYHSIHGAVTESKHVFIEAGLRHISTQGIDQVRIFEMGFGSGLNAYLSYLEARNLGLTIDYCGLESDPLPFSIIDKLSYPQCLNVANDHNIFKQIHSPSGLSKENFDLRVLHGKIQDITIPVNNNLIYYDAFGPSDQSELWTMKILSKVVASLALNGILVTYCAQGQFKRNLKHLGCEVESLPGPVGKREMVRATLRKT